MRESPKTTALQVQITGPQSVQIIHLVALGYGDGSTPASVVEYFLARALDDLRRSGIHWINTN